MACEGEDGGPKRTPLSENDIAAGKGRYVVEKVVAKALRSGVLHYQVQPSATANAVESLCFCVF